MVYTHLSIKKLIRKLIVYFVVLNVSFHKVNLIFGFTVIIIMIFQLISGIMLSFSLVAESTTISIVQDEEDIEDLYTDDFFLITWKRCWPIVYLFVLSFI